MKKPEWTIENVITSLENKGARMILRLVKFLLSLTNEPFAVVYKIPFGWKAYINCYPFESCMNGMNDAWKIAMTDERKKLTKAYRKERK